MPADPALIEFWFDFSSGYAFFAAARITALAERTGRAVLWRPYMLGTAFAVTGARGLSATPLKRDYARRDWARIARAEGLDFRLPEGHPRIALAATRAFYWIEAEALLAAVGCEDATRSGNNLMCHSGNCSTSCDAAASSMRPRSSRSHSTLVPAASMIASRPHTVSPPRTR